MLGLGQLTEYGKGVVLTRFIALLIFTNSSVFQTSNLIDSVVCSVTPWDRCVCTKFLAAA